MNFCTHGGLLVDKERFVPEASWDYQHPRVLPAIGCNNLRCESCGRDVRQQPGLREVSGKEVSPRVLYESSRWEDLVGIEPSHMTRLYACACTTWVETGCSFTDRPDADILDQYFTWRCAGHPPAQLPLSVDGLQLASGTDWGKVIRRVLRDGPPQLAPRGFGGYPGFRYLPRLYGLLDGHPEAPRFSSAVADSLSAFPTETTWFFTVFPEAVGLHKVLEALEAGLELPHGAGLPRIEPADLATELLKRAPDSDQAQRCLALLQARVLEPEVLPEDLLDVLARHSSVWLATHCSKLEEIGPGRGFEALRALEFAGRQAHCLVAAANLASRGDKAKQGFEQWLASTPVLPEVHELVNRALDSGTEILDVTDLLTVEDAVKLEGPKLAAWNLDQWEGKEVVAFYAVDDDVPLRLAWTACHPEDRDTRTGDLEQRGLSVGDYDDYTGFMWVRWNSGEITVWRGNEGRQLFTVGESLHCGQGRTLQRQDIRQVRTFLSDDQVERSVQVILKDNSVIDAVFDVQLNAESMLGYNHNDLLFDSAWTPQVGALIAAWADVRFVGRV